MIKIILFILILLIIITILIVNKQRFSNNIEKYNKNIHQNIILVDLVGGIGNQLYFLFMGFFFKEKYNNKTIYLVNKNFGYGRPMYFNTLFKKFTILEINEEDINNNFIFITEHNLNDDFNNKNICVKMEKGGYFQKTDRILPLLNKFKNQIMFNNNNFNKLNNKYKITNDDYLIHIRCTDNRTELNWHGIYKDYEINRIKEFILNKKIKRLFILCVDQNKIKDVFNDIKDTEFLFINSNNEIDDLYTITMFNNIIASPSTFCLWGCLLGFKPSKNYILLWDSHFDENNNSSNDFKNYRIDFYDNQYLTLLKINNDLQLDNFLLVSCYYIIKNKYKDGQYMKWFFNTLNIDNNMIIYVNNESIKYIKNIRNNINTNYIIYNINDFKTNNYNFKTNNIHVPSIEIARIWNEKINLIYLTEKIYSVDWYLWYDAGLASFRNLDKYKKINKNLLYNLDKDKIHYYQSENNIVTNIWEYKHDVAAGGFIINKNYIEQVFNEYYKMLDNCIKENNTYICGSEQVILSKLKYYNLINFNKLDIGYSKVFLKFI
jgi:hypothetical protein